MLQSLILRGDARRQKLDEIQVRRENLLVERAAALDAVATPDEYRTALHRSIASKDRSSLRFSARLMLHADRPREGRVFASLDADRPLTLHDLAWLFGEEHVVSRITDAVGPDAHDNAMTLADRKAALADLDKRIRALEEDEEAEVLRLQEQGIFALRRETVDPKILLEVWARGHEVKPRVARPRERVEILQQEAEAMGVTPL